MPMAIHHELHVLSDLLYARDDVCFFQMIRSFPLCKSLFVNGLFKRLTIVFKQTLHMSCIIRTQIPLQWERKLFASQWLICYIHLMAVYYHPSLTGLESLVLHYRTLIYINSDYFQLPWQIQSVLQTVWY
jgi:hypothetical protein